VEVRNGTITNFSGGTGVSVKNPNIAMPPTNSNIRLANLKVSGCIVGITIDALAAIVTNCQARLTELALPLLLLVLTTQA
jgi:hypothetical protein